MNDPKPPLDEDRFAQRLDQLHQEIRLDASRPMPVDPAGPLKSDQELQLAGKVLGLIERVRHSQESTANVAALPAETPADHLELPEVFGAGHPGSGETSTIGRFIVRRQLGQGGYGMVFLAYDPQLERDIAVKVPRLEAMMTPALRARFLREAKAAASLSHPNIVPVFEAGSAGSICYIAAKYIEGPTLAQWLQSDDVGTPVDQRDAARLLVALADAIEHAHQRGVLHRDLKPSNVLLETTDQLNDSQSEIAASSSKSPKTRSLSSAYSPRITDFGMAKIIGEASDQTQTGTIIGTPSYMSPEQTLAGKQEIDERTDLYSLGVIFYELLTGRPPFVAGNALRTMQRVQSAEPPRPSRLNPAVSKDVEAICLKCLEKNPAARYSSAYELQADVRRFLQNQSVLARPVSWRRRVAKWAHRNPLVATSLSLASAATVIGLVVTTSLWLRADRLRHDAVLSKQRAVEKASQLTLAVDDLLTGIAETPEIKLHGFEPLRAQLLERANQFYATFLREQPDDPELRLEFSYTLFRLAKIRAELGDREGALELAQQLAADLRRLDRQTVPRDQLLLQVMVLQAKQHAQLNHAEPTSDAIAAATKLAREAFTSAPTSSDQARMDLALALQGIADCLIQTGHRTDGNQLVLESVGLWQDVDPKTVDQSRNVANMAQAYVTAAQSLTASEDKQRAAPHADQAIRLFEQLLVADESPPPRVLSSLGRAHQIRGFLHDKDFPAAQASFAGATQVLSRLVDEHPMVPSYQRQLLAVAYNQALGYFIANRSEEDIASARRGFADNIVSCEQLISRFPQEKSPLTRMLGDNLTMLGLCQGRAGDFENQLETLSKSRTLVQKLFDESGGRPDTGLRLAGLDGDIGNCLISLGQYSTAVATLADSELQLLKILAVDPENGQAKRYLSNNYERSATAFAHLENWPEALSKHQESIAYFWSEPQEKYAQHSIYLLRVGQTEEAWRKLEEYSEFALQQFLDEQPGSDSNPTAVAAAAAEFLRTVEQLEGGELSESQKSEAQQQAAVVAVNALRHIVAYPERSRSDVTELLEQSELAPIKSTAAYQRWTQQRSASDGESN